MFNAERHGKQDRADLIVRVQAHVRSMSLTISLQSLSYKPPKCQIGRPEHEAICNLCVQCNAESDEDGDVDGAEKELRKAERADKIREGAAGGMHNSSIISL